MHKRHVFGSVIIALLLCSCGNFMLPNRVRIKAKPTFQVASGEVTFELNKYVSIAKLKEQMGETKGIEVFDYRPAGDNRMHLLLKYSHKETIHGLNIQSYLDQFDNVTKTGEKFGYEANGKPKVWFTIPTLNQQIDIDEIDLKDKLKLKEKLIFSTLNFNTEESGTSTSAEFHSGEIKWDTLKADGIVFDNNSQLNLNFSKLTDASDNFKLTIKKIAVLKRDGSLIKESSVNTSLDKSNAGTASLDVSNEKFPNSIKFKFSVVIEGGNSGQDVSFTLTPEWSTDTKLKKVIGYTGTLCEEARIVEQELILNADILKQAIIGKGSFKINANMPSIEKGTIAPKITLNLKQDTDSGYTGFDGSDLTGDLSGNIDLAGKTINSKPIKLSGKVQVTFADATIDFTNLKLAPTVDLTIARFSELKADTTGKIPDDEKIKIPLADVKKWVNWINFTALSINITVHNGIPIEVKHTIKSSELKIDDSVEIKAAKPNVVTTNKKITTRHMLPYKMEFAGLNDLVITIDANSLSGVNTFTDVVPGTDCSFCGEVSFDVDWDKAELKMPEDVGLKNKKFPENPIDLNFKDKLAKDNDALQKALKVINIKEVGVYAYASSPVLQKIFAKNIANGEQLVSGTIKVAYKKNGTADDTLYLVGKKGLSGDETANISLVDFPSPLIIEKGVASGSLPTTTGKITLHDTTQLTELINASPSDVQFTVNAIFGKNDAVTVEKKTVKDLTGRAFDISFDLFVDIPLVLKLNGTDHESGIGDCVKISLNELMKKENDKDLFGRSATTATNGTSVQEKALQQFDYISLTVNYINQSDLTPKLLIKHPNSNSVFSKLIDLKKGVGSTGLQLTNKDMAYICKTYPFNPTIELCLANGDIALWQDAKITVNVMGEIKMDIDQSFGANQGERK